MRSLRGGPVITATVSGLSAWILVATFAGLCLWALLTYRAICKRDAERPEPPVEILPAFDFKLARRPVASTKSPRVVRATEGTSHTSRMSQSTLQPHICGRCESAIAPYRSVEDGSQCGCSEPSSPAPVPTGKLCFYTKDVPVTLAPALDETVVMRRASSPDGAIDQEARETVLGCISELVERIGKVESSLAFLTGFVDDDALAAAIVGALGIRATEMREQIPALRQAIRDIPLMDGERS